MGIKHLNRFLNDNCEKSSIQKQSFNKLRNKTIVIDTSIYLYKYNAQSALLENFYLMISLFHKYNITPLFVFDGKPPPEKIDLLKQRKLIKQTAEEQFHRLKQQLEMESNNDEIRKSLNDEMDMLKRQFIRVSYSDNKLIKQLIQAYGAMYYDAPGEADLVCAYMVNTGKAWACLSDDMDMLVYGCERVLRHLSLHNETFILYKTNDVVNDLKMNMSVFRQITVLSGTDYNIDNNTSLIESMKWYEECMRSKNFTSDILNTPYGFYIWLNKHTKYIQNIDELIEIYNMFVIDQTEYQELDQLDIKLDTNYNTENLRNIMKKDGFVFT